MQATPPSRPKRPRRPNKKPSSSEIAESESDSEESDEVHKKAEPTANVTPSAVEKVWSIKSDI